MKPYLIVDLKPLTGVVFDDYLEGYSHWTWGDVDIIWGDLNEFIDKRELVDNDIVTYSFGDQTRLYMRGQFCIHKNNPTINNVWRRCEELNEKLEQELSRHTGTTERCYSYAVAGMPNIIVKYVVKAFSDWGDEDTVFVFDQGILKCPSKDVLDDCIAAAAQRNSRAQRSDQIRNLWGSQKASGPEALVHFTNKPCADWWKKYRVCITLPDKEELYNVEMKKNKAYAYKYTNHYFHGEASYERAAFFHFQIWKKFPAWKEHFKNFFPNETKESNTKQPLDPRQAKYRFVITRFGITPLGPSGDLKVLN